MARAIQDGCDHILTTGTLLSNHCRTTAIACSILGLKCTLLQTTNKQPREILTKGNILLSLMSDAECVLLPGETSREEVNVLLDKAFDKLKRENSKPYMILRGGTQGDAIFSYIEIFREMLTQPEFIAANISDIVVTSGSGGTAISLALASRLSGRNIKIHAIRVWGNNTIGDEILREELKSIDLDYDEYKDIIHYYDQYVGEGYGVSNPKIDDLVMSSMSTTGIPICTTYTGKATYGMLDLMHSKPEVFQGKNVMFMHTGGVPGLWGDENLHKKVESVIDDGRIVTSDKFFD